MPRPRKKNYSGNRVGRIPVYYTGDIGTRKKKEPSTPDENIDRDGFAPCDVCGYWVRKRIDGTLRAHNSKGGNTTRFTVPCIGTNPTDGDEWLKRRKGKHKLPKAIMPNHDSYVATAKEEVALLIGDLHDIRIEKKLTQAQVVERMGLAPGSGSFISSMEQGAIDPKISSVVRYAAALGVRFYIEEPEQEDN